MTLTLQLLWVTARPHRPTALPLSRGPLPPPPTHSRERPAQQRGREGVGRRTAPLRVPLSRARLVVAAAAGGGGVIVTRTSARSAAAGPAAGPAGGVGSGGGDSDVKESLWLRLVRRRLARRVQRRGR